MHGLRVERGSEVVVVRATGELDAFDAPELDRVLGDLLDARKVVIDLEGLAFLDSTALGRIVRCVRELGERDAGVRVLLPRGTGRRIFEITTLDRALPVAESYAAAQRELGTQAKS